MQVRRLSEQEAIGKTPVQKASPYRKTHKAKPRQRIPAINNRGLVIPPQVSETAGCALTREQQKKAFTDRHHLYFPRFVFLGNELATEFREHRFNSIWLPRYQHDRLHARYRAHINAYPTYLLPDDDIMASFLDEARLLDTLDVSVKTVDMIDKAILAGEIDDPDKALELRTKKIRRIEEIVTKAQEFELLSPIIAKSAVGHASKYLRVA